MVCQPGMPCYSLAGKVVQGRNTSGYDYQINPYGVPKTDEQRMMQHYDTYGTIDLPSRGTGQLTRGKLEGGFSWGTLFAGVVIGGILGYLVFAPSGRRIGSAAAGRVERKIRG